METSDFKNEWNERGYFVVRQLFDAPLVGQMKMICDRLLRQWLAESSSAEEASNNTNMAYLTERRYFKNHPEQLATLLEAIADEKSLSVFKKVFDAEPLFHNTQYFFEPASDTCAGEWHRDQQFGAVDIEAEKSAMSQVGVHIHIAFVPDDNLEIVPGTHLRWDTPEEFEIRKGLNGRKTNADDMPGATRISLAAGDACFFSAWSLHRGNYIAGKVRRTFDVIYGTAPGSYTPPPMCFLDSDVLDDVKSHTRVFFERFINAYKGKWEQGEYQY